jgi:hypothetical protein
VSVTEKVLDEWYEFKVSVTEKVSDEWYEFKVSVTEKVLDEWYEFKVCAQDLCLKDLLAKTVSHSDCFPILSKLLKTVSVLPASTSSCELGISQMNLIKH